MIFVQLSMTYPVFTDCRQSKGQSCVYTDIVHCYLSAKVHIQCLLKYLKKTRSTLDCKNTNALCRSVDYFSKLIANC